MVRVSQMVPMADPITDIFNRDWASIGGWSLFFSVAILIVVGAFREWWVPGPRHRRTEQLLEKSVETVSDLTVQNGQLITANEITKHFFEETTPKRHTGPDEGGGAA